MASTSDRDNRRRYEVVNGIVQEGVFVDIPHVDKRTFFTKIINIILEKIQPYHRRYVPSTNNVLRETPYE